MAMQNTALTVGAWVQVATAAKVLIVEATGIDVGLYIGNSAPGAGSPSFTLPSGVPVNVPNVEALGGSAWVRAIYANCAVSYAAA